MHDLNKIILWKGSHIVNDYQNDSPIIYEITFSRIYLKIFQSSSSTPCSYMIQKDIVPLQDKSKFCVNVGHSTH